MSALNIDPYWVSAMLCFPASVFFWVLVYRESKAGAVYYRPKRLPKSPRKSLLKRLPKQPPEERQPVGTLKRPRKLILKFNSLNKVDLDSMAWKIANNIYLEASQSDSRGRGPGTQPKAQSSASSHIPGGVMETGMGSAFFSTMKLWTRIACFLNLKISLRTGLKDACSGPTSILATPARLGLSQKSTIFQEIIS